MPLSLPVDMKVTVIIWLKLPLCNIILSVTYPDWLIRWKLPVTSEWQFAYRFSPKLVDIHKYKYTL